ncbi:MAG: Gfo/Idh/MocA family protein [Kiritimatiellia bacterium]|jgi:predicted dehydrogenase
MLRIAFAGFRHGHIMAAHNYIKAHPEEWRIVAACEEDAATRKELATAGEVEITHQCYNVMLDSVEFDVLAVGDYYSKRGQLIITALQRGKHVMADKPLCTDVKELEQIAKLAQTKKLKVGCLLDLRENGNFRRMREIVRGGMIGEVLSVSVTGQHALNLGVRPGWYFEPGKHGGTINDIGIHAFDFVPWMTGHDFAEVVAARVWNALAPQYPHFQTGAQYMLRLQNNAGMLADMSYFKPAQFKCSVPQYWRTTLFGSEGIAETNIAMDHVMLGRNGQSEWKKLPALPPSEDINIMHSFAREVQGASDGLIITTAEVLYASRVSLLVQQAADTNTTGVKLPART